MKRAGPIAAILTVLAVAAGGWWFTHRVKYVSGPIPLQIDLITPSWSPAVSDAVNVHADSFTQMAFLSGDISFSDGKPEANVTNYNYPTFGKAGPNLGLILRIDPPPPGSPPPFDAGSTQLIADAVHQMLAAAAKHGVNPTEVQIDFPCPVDHLADYAAWINAAHQAAGPVPLNVVIQPAWLTSPAIQQLIDPASGFILRETDPAAAQPDAISAAKLGKPFRVSLSTVGSDPNAMSALIRDWTANRPQLLTAILWDRFPIAGDQTGWTWPTLSAVMAGVTPVPDIQLELRQVEPTLTEIDLVNQGTADGIIHSDIAVSWTDVDLADSRALPDFDRTDTGRRSMLFHPLPTLATHPIRPAERRAVGWVRLTDDAPLHAQLTDTSIGN